ncbi:hypothetical protein F4703DRAFT_1793548 [Phycomyces blakesleeanus]
MEPNKVSNTTKKNKRNLIIHQYIPPSPSPSPKGQEELVLLQEYARIFSPTCPRESTSSEWQKVINAVNAVASDDKHLQYDACWHKELEYDMMKARKKDFIQKKEVVKNKLEKKQLNREERDEPMNMVTCNRDATVESKDSTMEDSTGTISADEHEAIYDMYMDEQTQFCQKMFESLSSQKEYQEKMLRYVSEQKKSNARMKKMMEKLVKILTDKK